MPSTARFPKSKLVGASCAASSTFFWSWRCNGWVKATHLSVEFRQEYTVPSCAFLLDGRSTCCGVHWCCGTQVAGNPAGHALDYQQFTSLWESSDCLYRKAYGDRWNCSVHMVTGFRFLTGRPDAVKLQRTNQRYAVTSGKFFFLS